MRRGLILVGFASFVLFFFFFSWGTSYTACIFKCLRGERYNIEALRRLPWRNYLEGDGMKEPPHKCVNIKNTAVSLASVISVPGVSPEISYKVAELVFFFPLPPFCLPLWI
jgi:hypothetical protein